jgi:hypothetical protein
MVSVLVLPATILLIVGIVVFLDWWRCRKEEQSRNRAA